MSEVSGKDFSVDTEVLRSDADTWDEQSGELKKGREALPAQPCALQARAGADDFLGQALALIQTYVTYCSQGEGQFDETAESLRKAANDYEKHEKEIF